MEVEPDGTLTTEVRDYVRPVMGGLQINFVRNGQVRDCTLGVNAYYSNTYVGVPVGTSGFFTASHCSVSQGATDGTVWSQGGVRIGYEMYDPPFFTQAQYAGCPPLNNCRWSDVTFAAYDAGVNRQHGAIAQTLDKTTQWDNGTIQNALAGSRIIKTTWPTFTINQTTTPPVMGVYWDKVGRTTGWTSGPVARTCTDAYVSQDGFATWNRLCQEYVSFFSQGGDSGGSVFVPTGQTTAAFAGIVWFWSGRFTYVSSIDRIRDDFGYGIHYSSY